jgi:hypothetical protein
MLRSFPNKHRNVSKIGYFRLQMKKFVCWASWYSYSLTLVQGPKGVGISPCEDGNEINFRNVVVLMLKTESMDKVQLNRLKRSTHVFIYGYVTMRSVACNI